MYGFWLVLLSLLVAGMMGCQKPAATTATPTVQPPTEGAAKPASAEATKPLPAEAAEPAPQEPAKPFTPFPRRVRPQTVKPTETEIVGGTPKIKVEKEVVDLGRVGLETKHKGQFKFTNAGDGPLKITHVGSCCGVTTQGVKDGQMYAPGASGVLEFEYQAPDTPSTADKKLQLHSNDPNQGITVLTIKSTVVRRVICKPEVLRLFLKKDNAGCPEIALTGLDDQPFSITDFKATGNAITVEFDPTVKDTEFVLKPKVDLESLEKNMRGQISISLTHPECGGVRVMFDTLPEFEISTPTIMMFGLKAGQAVQREFWVLNNYGEDFEIESVASEKGMIKLVDKTKMGNRYQLRVEVTPPERQGDSTVVSDTLEVKINGGRTRSIPFRGFYQDK